MAEPVRWRKVDGDKAADAALLVYDALLAVARLPASPAREGVSARLADALILMRQGNIPVPSFEER